MTDAPPPTSLRPNPPAGAAGTAAVSALIGVVFLMLGWPFAQWLTHPSGNPYGLQWTGGPLAGQAVRYFDLELGTAWKDLGLFSTGVVLLLEAALYAVLAARPAMARPVLGGVLLVAVVGAAINGLSVAMQLRAGFYQPIYAVVGMAVCVVSAISAFGRLRETRPRIAGAS